MIKIKLKKDFSEFPFGMYKTDGENSGQHFLEDHLLPLINNTEDTIIVDLRDLKGGISSSFYIAAFSHLVRHKNPVTQKLYTTEELSKRVKYIIESYDEYIKEEILIIAKEIEQGIKTEKAIEVLTNWNLEDYRQYKMLLKAEKMLSKTKKINYNIDLKKKIKEILKIKEKNIDESFNIIY